MSFTVYSFKQEFDGTKMWKNDPLCTLMKAVSALMLQEHMDTPPKGRDAMDIKTGMKKEG